MVAQGLSCPLETGTSHSSFVRDTSLLKEQQIHDQSTFLPFQEESPLQFPSRLSKIPAMLSKILEMLSKVPPMLSKVLEVLSKIPPMLSKIPPKLSKVLEMLSKVHPKLSQELSVTCST